MINYSKLYISSAVASCKNFIESCVSYLNHPTESELLYSP